MATSVLPVVEAVFLMAPPRRAASSCLAAAPPGDRRLVLRVADDQALEERDEVFAAVAVGGRTQLEQSRGAQLQRAAVREFPIWPSRRRRSRSCRRRAECRRGRGARPVQHFLAARLDFAALFIELGDDGRIRGRDAHVVQANERERAPREARRPARTSKKIILVIPIGKSSGINSCKALCLGRLESGALGRSKTDSSSLLERGSDNLDGGLSLTTRLEAIERVPFFLFHRREVVLRDHGDRHFCRSG